MTIVNRQFKLSHIFTGVSNLEEGKFLNSPVENHFNVPWSSAITRKKDYLAAYLHCSQPRKVDEKWSIDFELKMTLKTLSGRHTTWRKKHQFTNTTLNGTGWSMLISWDEMLKDYLIEDNAIIETTVTITKMSGIPRMKLRSFDNTTEEFSDVVIEVDREKFYVLKKLLASHSTYFKGLLLGNPDETESSEAVLSDTSAADFQCLLEVLYGGPALNDEAVEQMLCLAQKYEMPLLLRKCEEFLLEESKRSSKDKFRLAKQYKLENLKNPSRSSVISKVFTRIAPKALLRRLPIQDSALLPGAKFKLQHIFTNVSKLEAGGRLYSPDKEHFNVPWYLGISRSHNNYMGVYLYCRMPNEAVWSIDTDFKLTLKSSTEKRIVWKKSWQFSNTVLNGYGRNMFINWETMMKDYLIDDSAIVEASVKIGKMSGIPRKKLRSFEKSAEEYSDVIIEVDGVKFYVLKKFLAHSSYFKSLLLKCFMDFTISEVKLSEINPADFRNLLEALHGEPAITDDNLEGVLHLAHMYNMSVAIRKCEEFLVNKSKRSRGDIFKIAKQYKLDNLKKLSLLKINKIDEFKAAMEFNVAELDPTVLEEQKLSPTNDFTLFF